MGHRSPGQCDADRQRDVVLSSIAAAAPGMPLSGQRMRSDNETGRHRRRVESTSRMNDKNRTKIPSIIAVMSHGSTSFRFSITTYFSL